MNHSHQGKQEFQADPTYFTVLTELLLQNLTYQRESTIMHRERYCINKKQQLKQCTEKLNWADFQKHTNA